MGTALIEKALENGYKIIGIDCKEKGFLSQKTLSNTNFSFLKLDLTQDFSAALKNCVIDGIYHLAAQQPSHGGLTYDDFYKGNVLTTLNVINAAKTNKIKFIAYTSTVNFSKPRFPKEYLSEKSCPLPRNHYGLSKYLGERLLDIETSQSHTKVVIIRFPSLMGKHHLGGIAYTYYRLAKENKHIDILGSGKRIRNLLYIQDAVNVLLKAFQKQEGLSRFELFLAGSRNSLTNAKIAQIIKSEVKSNSKIIYVKQNNPSDNHILIDNRKAKKLLDFRPLTVEAGLKQFVKELGNEI